MAPIISIIVPVFNVFSYLPSMLDSIINQSLPAQKMEVILIDDGSNDGTINICKNYCRYYKNFRYVQQEHRGVSYARNSGIKLANGEWIVFLDGDDIISKDYLEKMLFYVLNKDVKMVQCSYSKCPQSLYKNEKINVHSITSSYYFNKMMDKSLPMYNGYLWNKIFNRNIILTHKLEFNENISLWEDMIFVEEYLKYISKVIIIDSKLYYYRIRNESITNQNNKINSEKKKASYELLKIFRFPSKSWFITLNILFRTKISIIKAKYLIWKEKKYS
ncbi:hypothetical protein DKZ22_09370 [Limosilactobacillus reuteri]|uniref:Glycosyltransferase 2-like domain-containing protein n=1 Tax=Limosilactobacillus reuteri TaxID=1598 RepID=A0A855XC23_LIMRT|nr:glycosyltransferase family 2 protein [Limosilactobacillus reuteri]PWT34548.1 hypothetical protein DKZ24_08415 [Limosilactobacillus reuteri]PWT36858.1 hypothetical protein DKZ35_08060 [Limosilactobacillus reuteri]PWT40178.1 hypothetical protein DKZ22_09370 [Limosilactobacillus reuteri]PWT40361.1 hypothetical protein DKZ34_06150 [Limosilactobacillus reuteri]PWT53382.1 hypothetical protein DKZ31_08295 [Limosilactobacillus reuteri]